MFAAHQKRRVSLLAKVLLPVLAMLVFLLGSTLWLADQHIRREFQADAARNLGTAEAVFQNSQQIRIKNLSLRFRTIPNEPRFKAVSQLGDPSTFRVLLAELLAELGADAAMFTIPDGKVLASATRTPALKREEVEIASLASIQQVITDGQTSVDLIGVGGNFYDAVSIPSIVGGRLVGVLTFALEMGESVAKEFKQLTHAEVVLLTKDRVAASTLMGALPPVNELTGAFVKPTGAARAAPDSIREIILGGEHFLGTSGRLTSLDSGQQLDYILLSSSEQHLGELRSTRRRIGLIGLAGIVLSTAILWTVILGATRPLRQLRDAAETIGHGDFSSRVPVDSRDECGELATVFNQMTENLNASRLQLQQAHDGLEVRVLERTRELSEEIGRRERAQREAQEAQKQLVIASRQAGMAEVAAGVLHNVGNALNSVNVSATLVADGLRNSKVTSLAKAVQLLSEHKDDVGEYLSRDPKGRLLPGFFGSLAENLTGEQVALTQEIQCLQRNIDHIKQIVAMQQSFAKVSGARESLVVHELIEEALVMAPVNLARHQIEVVRQFATVPPVLVDRHKVLQILVNLISNAEQALACRPDGRRLFLRIDSGEGDRLRVEVTDNGAGILKENLVRIFNHGFTTKKDGHGFGLHNGANAVREMGGSLSVRSDGPGHGATFVLELPVQSNGAGFGLTGACGQLDRVQWGAG